ncbi:MAG TPA: hypothetical protein V6D47_12220 [Oscillatoriaceae cyanobacterium]
MQETSSRVSERQAPVLESIAPGVESWTTKDRAQFRAFAVHKEGQVVLIDPVPLDADEEKAIRALGNVAAVLLTCYWHERATAETAARFGVPLYAHPDAIARLESKTAQPFPAQLPLGLELLDASGSTPGEVAFYLPDNGGAIIVGDSWHNIPLTRMPLPVRLILKFAIKLRDGLHLYPPSKAHDSQALIRQSREWLQRPVERLIVSHGDCLNHGAKDPMLARLNQGA